MRARTFVVVSLALLAMLAFGASCALVPCGPYTCADTLCGCLPQLGPDVPTGPASAIALPGSAGEMTSTRAALAMAY